jgi:hypothetical protein
MCTYGQPSKESVRRWLHDEVRRQRPPPGPDQIRRALGWTQARPDLLAAS